MRYSALILPGLVVVALVTLISLPVCESAKIIIMAMLESKSVMVFKEPLFLELAKRGHEVTVLSQIPWPMKHKNLRQVISPDMFQHREFARFSDNAFLARKHGNATAITFAFIQAQESMCEEFYEDPRVMALKNETFDLVMTAYTLNECTFGLVHHWRAPFILFHFQEPVPNNNPTGMPFPLSHLPIALLGFSDDMNFLQRTANFLLGQVAFATDIFYRIPKLEAVIKKHFPDFTSIDKVASNVSLVMANSDPALTFPRPLMPDVIEVAALHCRPAIKLPKNLEDFVEGSGEDGFILISFGSLLKASQMPDEFRKAFLGAFAKIKQRVIWKWETETMPDLPPNVMLSKWLPQQDLLGHPKCRAFISHGGLHSLEEAIYHGVPLIGIPFFFDQDSNMMLAKHHEIAIVLEYAVLTEQLVSDSIRTMLTEKMYAENVKRLSSIFRDTMDKPLDKAVYYMEYLLRHKGAPHLRSPARNLNYLQYHSLDVMAFLASALLAIAYGVHLIVRRCYTSVFKSASDYQKKID